MSYFWYFMKYLRTSLLFGFLLASSYFTGSLVSSLSSSKNIIDDQTKRAIELTTSKYRSTYDRTSASYLPLDFRYPYVYDPTKPSCALYTDTFIIDSPIKKLSIDSLLHLDSVTKDIKQRKSSFNVFYIKMVRNSYFKSSYNKNF